ncbi:hypothetical protein [Kiloniella sp.]|uniref:hypothetical protein n=1 Tax=Kiloniella sp. TaxID=1938587 RepID=UPI003B02449F
MSAIENDLSRTEFHWLEHARSCELNGVGMKAYAEAHDLDLKDFYHQKGELVKRGLFVVSSRDENLHKIVNGSADGPGLLYCQVCLRNGLEVKWPVSGRTSDLTSIVDALEGL